ncbi:hypothetical protein Ait01nite_029250 [Actinoplanes italicus]|uniref:Uncharacterized protein n=1 Tax=Actinoplanes italicus TaxID=113567 RepID=A0A2T0KIM8_9ACTN|nr:hypothetical protein [Actinoplanes italicus]PRX23380.1 hypothetical protein CLV67_103127 [Actinoplanes italicus]GIE29880.1 hypothetical protein Ait01nite_029250 [Actinoplanes italicus]
MWTAEEMDRRSAALRDDEITTEEGRVDDDLLDEIERNIDEYRDEFAKSRGTDSLEEMMEPSEDLADRLWSMGWLIYEASWQILQDMPPADLRAETERAARRIRRLAEAARALPWPHFAPRALGAIRADALVASKRDTQQGFLEAFDLHEQARNRHADFVLAHGSKPGRELYLLGLQEILLQLVLAETGTACRTAERVIGRWAEGLADDDRQWTTDDEDHWVQLMFRQLLIGVQIGVRALEVAAEIERAYGFIDVPTRDRLAKRTAFQNPGIMTARAALLALSLAAEMEELQPRPGGTYETWSAMRDAAVDAFLQGYRAIEKPVLDADGRPTPMNASHRRSLVQIRLHAAIVLPGLELPSELDFTPALTLDRLDDETAEALSGWLAEKVSGQRRGDANVVGSATMPAFIRSVDACRRSKGVTGGYREWRDRWFELDRYAEEPGRREHVRSALGTTGPA